MQPYRHLHPVLRNMHVGLPPVGLLLALAATVWLASFVCLGNLWRKRRGVTSSWLLLAFARRRSNRLPSLLRIS